MRLCWLAAVALTAACSGESADVPSPDSTDVSVDMADVLDVADVGSDLVASDVRQETEVVDSIPIGISFERLRSGDFIWGTQPVAVVTEGDVASVEFLLDGELVRTDESPPYVSVLEAGDLAAGMHLYEAVARGPDGVARVEVTLEVDGQRPTLTVVQPGVGGSGPVDGELTVEVVATDNHEVAYIDLTLDLGIPVGRLYGEERVGVFPVDVEPGLHQLSVGAFDRTGLARFEVVPFIVCDDSSALPCQGTCLPTGEFEQLVSNCGGCGITCGNGEFCSEADCVCEAPRELCGSTCSDLSRDPRHCGECGEQCAGACLEGECVTGVSPGFRLISPGEFVMGSEPDEWGSVPFEQPSHRVTITRPYLIGETEVTQGQWFELMGTTPSTYWDCGADCPVESVTWWEAIAYTNALSVAEGLEPCYVPGGCTDIDWGLGRTCRSLFINAPDQNPLGCEGYRLPTEAEWEFAARGGATGNSTAGDILSLECRENMALTESAWFDCNGRGQPQAVGQLEPNPYGLYDIFGNVFEWVGDKWGDFSAEDQIDPIGVDEEIVIRPMRGGSFSERSDRLRISARLSENPDGSRSFLGFRVGRTW